MVLSNADLLARATKLQREQQARSNKAKQKLEAEKLAQARVREHHAALEAEKARLRAEQLRAQEEVRSPHHNSDIQVPTNASTTSPGGDTARRRARAQQRRPVPCRAG